MSSKQNSLKCFFTHYVMFLNNSSVMTLTDKKAEMQKHTNVCRSIGFCAPHYEQLEKQKDISDWKILFHFQFLPFSCHRNNQNINMGVRSSTALICHFPYLYSYWSPITQHFTHRYEHACLCALMHTDRGAL